MRYNVHQSRNKSTGVLVGAALVAALGLPSVAQAQPPGTPTVGYMADQLTATVAGRSDQRRHNHWVFEVMEPGSSAFRTMGAVEVNSLLGGLHPLWPAQGARQAMGSGCSKCMPLGLADVGDEDPRHLNYSGGDPGIRVW